MWFDRATASEQPREFPPVSRVSPRPPLLDVHEDRVAVQPAGHEFAIRLVLLAILHGKGSITGGGLISGSGAPRGKPATSRRVRRGEIVSSA